MFILNLPLQGRRNWRFYVSEGQLHEDVRYLWTFMARGGCIYKETHHMQMNTLRFLEGDSKFLAYKDNICWLDYITMSRWKVDNSLLLLTLMRSGTLPYMQMVFIFGGAFESLCCEHYCCKHFRLKSTKVVLQCQVETIKGETWGEKSVS
jgi:hypothetical protein